MNKAELIKGINVTIEGLTAIKNALNAEGEVSSTTDSPVVTGSFSREQLEGMPFNEFKKLAASLGVKCTGSRNDIIERVLNLNVEVPTEEVSEEEDVEEAEVPVEEVEETEEEVEEEVDYTELAKSIIEESGADECISALKEVGVKATKKNLVDKLADAIENGLIEIEDDEEDYESDSTAEEDFEDEEEESEDSDEDEEDSEEEDEEDDDEGEEVDASSYFEEYDPNGINNPDDMTEERKEAVESMMSEILDSIEDDDFFNTVEEYLDVNMSANDKKLLGSDPDDDEKIKLYMEMKKRTIDDDGEIHEPAEAESEEGDPYEISGHDMCCGHELKYVKKTKKYICEHCGAEFEAE